MKKNIIIILVVSVLLIGVPFISNTAQAKELSIREFINILVTVGIITPDKMPAVNTFLATLGDVETKNSTSTITVIYPNGGEEITNSSIMIRWNSSQSASTNVDISLIKYYPTGPMGYYVVQNGVKNSGQYIWPVGQFADSNGRYSSLMRGTFLIKICQTLTYGQYICDTGDNYSHFDFAGVE